jgi:PAS domain-containing protein
LTTANLLSLGLGEGLAPTTLQGWMEHVHADDAAAFEERLRAALQPDGPLFDLEYRMRRQDGHVLWMHTKGSVIQRGAQGQPELAVGTSMNISGRKLAEQAVRDSEARSRNLASLLRLMADNVPDMIWAKDLDKRYLFANRALCRHLLNATDTDEPVGKTDVFFALRERQRHPEDPQWHTFGELCQDSDTITLQRGVASEFEEYGHLQGRLTYLEVHKAPFVNERGEVIGTVGSARDITERIRTQAELQQVEALYKLVAEHASDVIWLYDLVNERFTYVSPSVQQAAWLHG